MIKLLFWTKDVEWVKWFNAILFCSLCNDTVEPNHNGPRKKSHPSPQKILVFQWVDFKLHQVKALFVLKIAKQNAKLQLKEIEIESGSKMCFFCAKKQMRMDSPIQMFAVQYGAEQFRFVKVIRWISFKFYMDLSKLVFGFLYSYMDLSKLKQ